MTSGEAEEKSKSATVQSPQKTFQGVSNYPPPPQPQATGFPQPAPPPAVKNYPSSQLYVRNYQTDPGYAVTQGGDRLPCCGIGVGWGLFIAGFFLGSIPWYIGFILLICSKEPREKPGCIACTVAAVVGTLIVALHLTGFF